MNRENERKLKNDTEKFEALLKQKEQMIADWDEKITHTKISMSEQIEQIKIEHEVQRNNLEEEMATLEHEQKGLELEIPEMRAKAEEKAWNDIDKLEDKNKSLLLYEIERGVEKAAELTEQKQMLKEYAAEKQSILVKIDEKNHQFEKQVQAQKSHREMIQTLESQLRERDETLEEKKQRIEE